MGTVYTITEKLFTYRKIIRYAGVSGVILIFAIV